jgi:hypothetical protein
MLSSTLKRGQPRLSAELLNLYCERWEGRQVQLPSRTRSGNGRNVERYMKDALEALRECLGGAAGEVL